MNKKPSSIPLTYILIILCVVVAVLSNGGKSRDFLNGLFIVSADHSIFDVLRIHWWRLITPIFIHFGFPHLIFNMMCLYDFASFLEKKEGTWFLALFISIVAVVSNLAQYKITHSPTFGGMSGVAYALFGYLWIYARFRPKYGYVMSDSSVLIMLLWFVLCWTGVLGSVANWVHAAGLAIGMLWGGANGWIDQIKEKQGK